MTVLFWILAAGMVAVALLILFFGVRHGGRSEAIDRDDQNTEIAREKLDKLKRDLAAGILAQAQFDQLRSELERELGVDLAGPQETADGTRNGYRGLAIFTVIAVPAAAFALYAWLGNPTMLTPLPASGGAVSLAQVSKRLQAHLHQAPKDADAWFMLGHVYMQENLYQQAANAYRHARTFVPDDPDVLLSLADALAMTQDGRLKGKPAQLVDEALAAAPNNPTALWLAGMAAEQQGDYVQAVWHWRRVASLVTDHKTLTQVHSLIATAEKKLGHPVPPEPGAAPVAHKGKDLEVVVRLAPALERQLRPDDTVFVFARAESGAPMPLAVARKSVKDLPLKITLTDSMAMIPAMHISAFRHVLVGARISRSGNAMPQAGDLESSLVRAVPGQKGEISLEINKKVSG